MCENLQLIIVLTRGKVTVKDEGRSFRLLSMYSIFTVRSTLIPLLEKPKKGLFCEVSGCHGGRV
jgi:hypothetical protein